MSTILDVAWPICNRGRIPIHHQYPLLSAISRIAPEVHNSEAFGVHPIRGFPSAPSYLELTQWSALKIRTSTNQLEQLLKMSGEKLQLAGHPIRLGVPHLHNLVASKVLNSHMVTIKGYFESDDIKVGIRKQMDHENVSPLVNIVVGQRRVLRIKQQVIVGFQIQLEGLSDQESLCLQEKGIGGRRHLGCGLFNPAKQVQECSRRGTKK